MSTQKIIGWLIIAISILTFSLQKSLASLSRFIDETTGEFWSKGYEYKYMDVSVYVFFLIAVAIGIYLIVKKPKDNN
ncbi:hypothetical protein [Clostridium sp.]|uniref:hypothetical protein n=1 Tax=Clostridium sp. TaxID=1506 RepID=UPI002FC9B6AA